MKLLLEKLISIFNLQTDLHQSLISVLEEEKKAIIDSDHFELTRVSHEKTNLILRIQKQEDQRSIIHASLAEALEKTPQELTLKGLCRLIEEPYSSRLNFCRSNFVPLLNKVRKENDGNKILLFQSIELVRSSLNILNSLMSSNSVYYQTGKIKDADQSGRVFSGEF